MTRFLFFVSIAITVDDPEDHSFHPFSTIDEDDENTREEECEKYDVVFLYLDQLNLLLQRCLECGADIIEKNNFTESRLQVCCSYGM